MNKKIKLNQEFCSDYGFKLHKYYFPVWLIIFIIVLVIGIITFIEYFVIKNKNDFRYKEILTIDKLKLFV